MITEQDITNNIQAINPNLEKLKQAFPHCFDKNGAFDFAKFKAELDSNDINIAKEGYGLNWLGKSYARVLASDAATTLLKEDEAHNTKPENANSQNLLIKGDNLEVLKHLSNAYYEKVKMIYIDPPYNTGSDGFVYNDDRKFTAKQLQDLAGVSEDEAKRILEFTQSNSNSHSAWLTFMYPRLYIAKQLLKDDGVIFVSIDDNEVAQLRLLMDEVFGEENFVTQISRATGTPTGGGNENFVNELDYIIIYAKESAKLKINGLEFSEKDESIYNQEDDQGKYLTRSLRRTGGEDRREDRPTMFYGIESPDKEIVFPLGPSGYESRWICGKQKYEELVQNNLIEWRQSKGKWQVYQKFYLENRTKLPGNLWNNIEGNKKATIETRQLFDSKKVFDFPKPTDLILKLIKLVFTDNDEIILDFFAGSGTTAHSVMQLNAEDGGNRKFILVQLPELIDAKKSKVAYDFVKDELGVTPPTIFEITKERIIRAAKQINAAIDSKIEKLKNELPTEENKAEIAKYLALKTQNSFKIFETTPIWEDYDFKAEKLANAEKLFDDEKLTEADVKALFTTWKTYDGSPLTEPVQEVYLAGYKGYYTKQKLYLMYKGFSTATLKALLEHIDADANFNPIAIIAFGYYFESKALREIAENIKTYNNKKNIDIDFITRY
ncbi:site-specific DNA-methyltransferase [Myroides odoratimimus]|uniref:site-specific DNA-methyltransferase n=1 Tax=Myroides odoratimimus TaxID=76832 RepID=UPI00257502A5|nr:site-specific DNA-methyltransferase [Myroides odoratimimus]MDM1450421.1 site-specific DNA-methyltransferase [Myroides odoratimimus]